MKEASVALLRGINVGGHRKIKMQELKALFEQLGAEAVSSYIQSGNIVYNDPKQALEASIIEQAILDRFGFEVSVFCYKSHAFQTLLNQNPFPNEGQSNPKALQLYFLSQPPHPDQLPELEKWVKMEEQYQLIEQALWVYYPLSVGRSKLNNARIEKTLGLVSTARNFNTLKRLESMLNP